ATALESPRSHSLRARSRSNAASDTDSSLRETSGEVATAVGPAAVAPSAPWQSLKRLPLPQGQGALREAGGAKELIGANARPRCAASRLRGRGHSRPCRTAASWGGSRPDAGDSARATPARWRG